MREMGMWCDNGAVSSLELDTDDTVKEVTEKTAEEDGEENAEIQSEDNNVKTAKRGAQRAWRVVRRHIREQRVEKRTATGSMNWDFLRQTLAAMTDLERTRQELYDKYLYRINWWTEDLTQCPERLRFRIAENYPPSGTLSTHEKRKAQRRKEETGASTDDEGAQKPGLRQKPIL